MYWQSPNHVVLGGNLTFDPSIREIKNSEGSSKVVDFSIANNLKSSGSPAGKAHFFKCEAWGKTAELVQEYFKKIKKEKITIGFGLDQPIPDDIIDIIFTNLI
jgi:hypothetical protein